MVPHLHGAEQGVASEDVQCVHIRTAADQELDNCLLALLNGGGVGSLTMVSLPS